MDDAGFLLNEFDADWVNANSGLIEREAFERRRAMIPQCVICKNGGSAIAARSGSVISSQSCTVYKGSGGSLASIDRTLDVYNLSSSAVAANAYLIAALVGDIWVAVWEDC